VAFLGLYRESSFQAASVAGLKAGLGPGGVVLEHAEDHWDLTDPARVGRALQAVLKKVPSALVVSNVDQAEVILDLCQAQGLRVPQDLSVISFGPRSQGQRARKPLLSLLETDLHQGGVDAYGLVKEGLEGKAPRVLTLPWSSQAEGATLAKA